MKTFLAFVVLALCVQAHATPPEYFSSRKWVEEKSATNRIPQEERLFIGRVVPQEYAGIVRYHKGITLREIIDQTPFKGTNVVVCVLRPKVDPRANLFTVKASDRPQFEVLALDMIWIMEDGPIVW